MRNVLICFPGAGGSAGSFQDYKKNQELLGSEVLCMEYSGHWTRHKEALYGDFKELLQDMTEKVLQQIDREDHIFLLGHSMGGYVAFELAHELNRRGYQVKGLFPMACMPLLSWERLPVNPDSDEEIFEFLRNARNMTKDEEKVIMGHFFRENFLPGIRNDLRNLITYRENTTACEQVLCDMICFRGLQDPLVDSMEVWKQYTKGDCRVEKCEGDHHFLHDGDNVKKIVAILAEAIVSFGEK